jgi:hypothetical protein
MKVEAANHNHQISTAVTPNMSRDTAFTTVIFDLGGVVLDSPFAQFSLLEEKLGFEKHTLSKVSFLSIKTLHIASARTHLRFPRLKSRFILRCLFSPAQLVLLKGWNGVRSTRRLSNAFLSKVRFPIANKKI